MKLQALYLSFYLNRRTYIIGACAVLLYALSYFIPVFMDVANIVIGLLCIGIITDAFLLYAKSKPITGQRNCKQRFSNGDDNSIELKISNAYSFPINADVIDELPIQLQERNWHRSIALKAGETNNINYSIRPVERGEYLFGRILVFVQSPLRLIKRRCAIERTETVYVYPSYVQMRKYQLLAATHQLSEVGSKRVRKIGNSTEFEQIKDYVRGDDYRTVNWKATARKGQLMVNTYVDEKSQQIYCLIDKSRSMKMPFEGLTLLDYAINASLVLSNVTLYKQDKAGLITFAQKVDTFLPAERTPGQMELILNDLYAQQTDFLDADFGAVYAQVRAKIKQRSLLILFTNFESMYGLERQMPVLRKLAHYHLLVVVFFENTEIASVVKQEAKTTEEIYIKTIAEKFAYEKRLLVKELHKNGILSLLTPPQQLTANTINKYLDIKIRNLI